MDRINKKQSAGPPPASGSDDGAGTGYLHELAFDNSAQANIISEVATGRIIAANKAACVLLGYSEAQLRAKTRPVVFNIAEESFVRMLRERGDTGSAKATVCVTRSTGRKITCEITSAVFVRNGIEAAITTIVDRSQSIARQRRLDAERQKEVAADISSARTRQRGIDRKKEKKVATDIADALLVSDNRLAHQEKESQDFLLDARFSLDVIWDWKLASNKTFIGEGYEALFGHPVAGHMMDAGTWSLRLHPADRARVKRSLGVAIASAATHWEQQYRLVRADGSFARISDRASIFRDAGGAALRLIGVMQDISRHRENNLARVQPHDKKSALVGKIKDLLIRVIQFSEERLEVNYSGYLSATLGYDYNYLSNLFSEVEGMTIQKFTISQKIERAKELLLEGLTLTEVAYRLHYSSVAHLSKQFRKSTGDTPTAFRQHARRQ